MLQWVLVWCGCAVYCFGAYVNWRSHRQWQRLTRQYDHYVQTLEALVQQQERS